jgi:hypothetical protein
LADAQRAAKAAKKLADRRFKRFKADMQEVIDGGRYDKDDYKTVAVGPTNRPTNQKDSDKVWHRSPVTCSWRGKICGVGAD